MCDNSLGWARLTKESYPTLRDAMHRMLIVLAGLAALPVAAQAYIDPGTGSMFLQMMVGGLLAGAAMLRVFWRRIKGLVEKGGRKESGG